MSVGEERLVVVSEWVVVQWYWVLSIDCAGYQQAARWEREELNVSVPHASRLYTWYSTLKLTISMSTKSVRQSPTRHSYQYKSLNNLHTAKHRYKAAPNINSLDRSRFRASASELTKSKYPTVLSRKRIWHTYKGRLCESFVFLFVFLFISLF